MSSVADPECGVVEVDVGQPGPPGLTGPPGPPGPQGVPGYPAGGLTKQVLRHRGGAPVWEWGPGPVYNVMDYAAVGDGSAPDLAAFNNALTDCPPGGTLVLDPTKTHAFEGTWTINKPVRVMLNGATLKCTYAGATANTPLIKVTSPGVRIDGGGGILDGDRLNHPQGGPCLWTAHSSGVVKVRNLIVKSAAFHGIYHELAGATLDLRGVESYDHKDNAALHNASGVRVVAGVLRMVDYYGHDNDQHALNLSGTGVGHYIEGFRSRHNAQYGFWILGGTGGQIIGAASYDDNSMSFVFENVHDWEATGLESLYQGQAMDGNYSDGTGVTGAGTGLQITNCYAIQADVKVAKAQGYGIAIGGNSYECVVHGDCYRNGDPDFTLSSGVHHNIITGTSLYGTVALSIGEARGDVHHNDIDLIVVGAGWGAMEGNVGSYNDITLRCRDCRTYDTTLGAGLIHMWGDSFNNNTITLTTEHADVDYGVEGSLCTVAIPSGGPNGATIDNAGHAWVTNQWVGYAALWKTGANAGTVRRINGVTINSNSPTNTQHALTFDAVPAGTPTPANAQPGETFIIIPASKYIVDFKDRAYNNYPAVARQTDNVAGQVDIGTHVYAVTVVGPGYEVPVTPQLPTANGGPSGVVTVDATHTSVLIGTLTVGAGGGLPVGRRGHTGRNIYRSKANTLSPLFLVATVDTNANGYLDRIPDASLGVQMPVPLGTMYTAWGNRVVSMDVAPESYTDAVIRDGGGLNPLINAGRLTRTRRVTGSVANNGTYAPDLSLGRLFALSCNGAAATLATPLWSPGTGEADEFTIEVLNNTAGALNLTVTAYVFPTAFVAPAAGKRKLLTFKWSGTAWVNTVMSADY